MLSKVLILGAKSTIMSDPMNLSIWTPLDLTIRAALAVSLRGLCHLNMIRVYKYERLMIKGVFLSRIAPSVLEKHWLDSMLLWKKLGNMNGGCFSVIKRSVRLS